MKRFFYWSLIGIFIFQLRQCDFLVIFQNEITTILTTSTSERGELLRPVHTGVVCHAVAVSHGRLVVLYHTLARSYMRSREPVDWRMERKSAWTDPRTNRPSVVGVYRHCVNSNPEFFVHFWPYINDQKKKKKDKTDAYRQVGHNEGHH